MQSFNNANVKVVEQACFLLYIALSVFVCWSDFNLLSMDVFCTVIGIPMLIYKQWPELTDLGKQIRLKFVFYFSDRLQLF